ncbi:MAG: hemerythrin protein [Proteobacteria bacterium]|nr:hemerythrin protein [Pseudomonadota bacterium]
MTDSLLPHAPSLDEPLEMLEACHGRIEAQLQTLERLLVYLPQHGADDQARQAARNILRYFDLAGPNHHEDEERSLFPTLIARAGVDETAAVQSLVQNLLSDHVRMAVALDVVRMQLTPIADGTGSALEEAAVRRMAELYRQHIAKENRDLLPLSRRLLQTPDLEELSRAMTARRTPRSD